ncbi:Splicing factor-like protein 1 [Cardamine amara subsp. amara]|uniref:Splicing factor-like protein 1 n=1 Tax=Cardamine amara subsp. amara TaxID=228776 RepID=A0ABD0ZYG6_CARAN
MTSTSGTKISMFGAKSGFIIPKNKLSGSLIPIFQRAKNLGGSDTTTKLGKRKSNWGPDLTQDTSVKKCRVLAYQKRLDQITQQLESGTLEAETNRSLTYQNNSDIAEHLEFEKRKIIGEILVLNPRYKAPPDYKPLLKEARLSINVKEHFDFSFLSLILSSQGDTQKRLEKETGAKVQIFGTKTGGEKVELSPSDENEIQTWWEELYFQISSDTYEKVDAAFAVIELLISSVSGNTRADTAQSSRSEDISTIPGNSNTTATDLNFEQPTDSSVQPPESQFQHQGSSFHLASNQPPFHPPFNPSASGLGNSIQDQELPTISMNLNPHFNHSASGLGNSIQDQELPTISMNLNSHFSQQQLPIPHNTSLPSGSQIPRPPDTFSFSLSNTPRAYSGVAPQGSLAQLGFSTAPPYSDNQIQPIGPRSTIRPSTLFTFLPVSSSEFRPTPLPDILPSNMAQSIRPLATNFSPHLVAHQPGAELPSVPFPSSISQKLVAEYGGLRPMSVSAHIAGRPAGYVPTYPSINPPSNTAPRSFHGDFGFLQQQCNVLGTTQIAPRSNSQSAPLPYLAFQAPSVTSASQHFGQSFARSQHFGRQMDHSLSHPPAPFHGNARSSNLQSFGPPLPQIMPRNFPGAQFPQHSAHFPPRPPSGQPQIHHLFNSGVHQVYDPFSPSDA